MLPSMDEPTEAIREPVDILAQTISLVGIDQGMSLGQPSAIKSKLSITDVAPDKFLEKYHHRELFHKRSKDNMYRKMRRKNQALETKCKEKDWLLANQNYKFEALEAKSHSKDLKIEALEVLLESQSRENELLRRQIQELQVLL